MFSMRLNFTFFCRQVLKTSDGETPEGKDQPQPGDTTASHARKHSWWGLQGQHTFRIFSTHCDVAIVKTSFLFCIELEESKGGKGGNSGERGQLSEDREGHEGSEGHRATDSNLHQAAGVSWWQEVLPDEDQRLYRQQKQRCDGRCWREWCPSFAETSPAPAPQRTCLRSTYAHYCLWLNFVYPALVPAAERRRTPTPHSQSYSLQGAVLSHDKHHWPCVETLASVIKTSCKYQTV